MRPLVCNLIFLGALSVLLVNCHSALADPAPKQPAADPLAAKVKEVQEKGIKYLKQQQRDQGNKTWNWRNDSLILQPGGISALALLALLESGVKADDEVVARGLSYLRTVEPTCTYVVSVQTQVFCKVNQKEDTDRIKRNVKWLEDATVRTGKVFEGWNYTAKSTSRADHSNTRFAVAALYAALRAGFKVKQEELWDEVRNLFIRTQNADGGWGYIPELAKHGAHLYRSTHSMTASALVCLNLAKNVIGKEEKAHEAARRKGEEWIAGHFSLEDLPSTFYNLDAIAALGRASEVKVLGTKDKNHEWYQLGAEWLLKNQKPGGEWKRNTTLDNFEIISTSFALRFLANRPD